MALTKKQAKKIKEYYSAQIISDRLKNIAPTGKDKGDAYAKTVYDAYHITQYSNKGEYELAVQAQTRAIVIHANQPEIKQMRRQRKDVNAFIDKLTQDRIDEGWRDYQHRDDLIRTGQYEEFRTLDYKTNYVKSMKGWALDAKYIDAIENADINKLKILFSLPDTEKDSKDKYQLPVLGFYYGKLDNNQLAEVINKIELALKAANIFVDDITIETTIPEMHEKYKERAFSIAEKSIARTAYRNLQLTDRPEELNYDELYSSMLYAYENKRLKVKTNKKGYKYIPFVGSTNPKSKNSKFMRDFVDYARAVGVKFDK